MTKSELAEQMAATVGLSKKEALAAIDEVLNRIKAEVEQGNAVSFKDFGTFCPKTTTARTGRNPRTGESLEIPAKKTVKFKPFKGFMG